MDETAFHKRFEELTSYAPLAWQWRLFDEWFSQGKFPEVIDLPTGLGKTMVMAIWLIAREVNEQLPRRLIYVVDRRTVVDQATDVAIKLQDNVGEAQLAVSTLRGQRADNRKWSADLSQPAIVIGTVDLIGSGLLFAGYRSSFKRRPLEAGLLGQDSLVVLDEAHLSKPFDKLITSISSFQSGQGSPMQAIRMSATATNGGPARFDLSKADLKDPVVKERFNAKKRLTIVDSVETAKLNDALAREALELAASNALIGKRIVVFVRSPESAMKIADVIRKKDSTKSKPGPHAESVETLTGTMRGLERDKLLVTPVMQRFLSGALEPDSEENQAPVFLVSTSAGEVGFDLNADHLVCDVAPLDSMIQRFGRVNRRGKGKASVLLVRVNEPDDKTDYHRACIASSALFDDGMELSPAEIGRLKSARTPEELQAASTPVPETVELTDILLDAWSMTSITGRMPGRPAVAPWIRGIANDLPQTTIAWRAEVGLFQDDPNAARILRMVFSKHGIRPHESLTTNSSRVVAFLNEIRKKHAKLLGTQVALIFAADLIVTTIERLLADEEILNRDPTLVFPATFGGIRDGMLDADAVSGPPGPDDPPLSSFDVADHSGYESIAGAQARMRVLVERTSDNEWRGVALPGGAPIPAAWRLEETYDTSRELFDVLKSVGLRIRLVQPVTFDEEGDPRQSLVLLAPAPQSQRNEDQLLDEHVAEVRSNIARITSALGLSSSLVVSSNFAAAWHDEGKKATIWQRFAYGPDAQGRPVGKMSRARQPASLGGYRHEFGSLLRVVYPYSENPFELPEDSDACELALHLIATHHGFGRPHFDHPHDREFPDKQIAAIHVECLRRFARLQGQYGWWRLAWLENLLRCADQSASADAEADDVDEARNDVRGES